MNIIVFYVFLAAESESYIRNSPTHLEFTAAYDLLVSKTVANQK